MALRIDFTDNESYHTSHPQDNLGYAAPEGYRLNADGFVALEFGGNVFRKIPVRRLLRITES